MDQSTNPESPEVAEAGLSDDRLLNAFGIANEQEAPEEAPAEEATEADPDALDVDLGDDPPAEAEDFELTHQGKPVRVSKEEAKNLAQMGYDYTQKSQQNAQTAQQLKQYKEMLEAKAQIHPQVVESLATVKMYERALQQYANVNWAQESQSDPIGTMNKRIEMDQLRDGFNQAVAQYQQSTQLQQRVQADIAAADLSGEMAKLQDAVPEWRDAKRYQADAQEIGSALKSYGITDFELGQLADSRFVLIARDAMLYRKAKQAQQARTQGKAPAVARPGAVPMRTESKQARIADLTKKHRFTKDATTKRAVVDDIIATKFGLK